MLPVPAAVASAFPAFVISMARCHGMYSTPPVETKDVVIVARGDRWLFSARIDGKDIIEVVRGELARRGLA